MSSTVVHAGIGGSIGAESIFRHQVFQGAGWGRRRPRGKFFAAVAPLVVSLAAAASAQEPTAPRTEDPVKEHADQAAKQATQAAKQAAQAAEQALQAARDAKKLATGKKGEERHELLERCAAAYERAASGHPEVAVVVAEAWFRAGEIYRTLRNFEDSQRCFEASRKLSQIPTFAARATAELGHLHRRVKEYEAAIEFYQKVALDFPDERQEGVRALTWEGKTRLLLEQHEEGHRLLLAAADRYPDFPVDAIRNVDTVATDWIEAGRIDEARELLEACRSRYRASSGGAGPAEETLAALEKMKAPELLNEVVDPETSAGS